MQRDSMLTAIERIVTRSRPARALLPAEPPRHFRRALAACVGLMLLLAAADGPCRERPRSAPPPAASTRAQPQSASNGPSTAAWTVLITSLAAGAGTAAYGLGITCEEGDRDCRRRSSLAIWGGIGIASIGSAIALASMQPDDSPPRTSRGLRWNVQTATGSELGRAGTTAFVSVAGVF